MESILLIMTMLCLLTGIFRNSLSPGKYYPAVFAVVCALFVLLSGRYAVQVNKLAVSAAFADLGVMQNVNVLITLHLLFTLGFAASKMQKAFGLKRTLFYRILEYVPALLVFPALFYCHIVLLFSFAGVSFTLLGTVFALVTLLCMGGGAYLFRAAVPETELRTELLLIVELLLFVLMLCSTVFHPSKSLFSIDTPVDWQSLCYTLGVVAILFAVGYWGLLPRLKTLFRSKRSI